MSLPVNFGMTPPVSPSGAIAGSVLPIRRAEELIATLQGVLSVRIVPSSSGAIEEIHVLTTDAVLPKQTVRNIESALMAQLGLRVNHRKVSIATTLDSSRAMDLPPVAAAAPVPAPVAAPPSPAPAAAPTSVAAAPVAAAPAAPAPAASPVTSMPSSPNGTAYAANGAHGPASNGAMSNGAMSNGAMSNGAMSNGAMSNGAMSNGAMSNGAMTHGAMTNGSHANGSTNGSLEYGAPTNGTRRVVAEGPSAARGASHDVAPNASAVATPSRGVGRQLHGELAPPTRRALIFEDVEVRRSRSRGVLCKVTLGRDGQEFIGEAEGQESERSRIELAARATLIAIAQAMQVVPGAERLLALEGSKFIEAFDREFIFVSINARFGRDIVVLTGSCEVRESPETSAVLAVLDATNRWMQLDR